MTLVMIIAGVWLLGSLVAILALCAAARRPVPTPDTRLAQCSGGKVDTITIPSGSVAPKPVTDYHLADAA